MLYTRRSGKPMSVNLLEHLHVLEDAARRGSRLFLVLDFDGTLTPIAGKPTEVTLQPEMADLLTELTSSNHVSIAVISGRSIYDLTRRVHLRDAVLAGNHGLEIISPNWTFTYPDAVAFQHELGCMCGELGWALETFENAWVENKRLTATVHYRQLDVRRHEDLKRIVRRSIASSRGRFTLRSGKLALEIRPRVPWDKGAAVQLIRARNGMAAAQCVCMGDDRTDESIFQRLPDAINVLVGPRPGSAAAYHLEDSEEVFCALSLLQAFVRSAERRHERQQRRPFIAEAAWGRMPGVWR